MTEGFLQFEETEAQQQEKLAGLPGGGPQVRQAAVGADVIDMTAMIAELEQSRQAR